MAHLRLFNPRNLETRTLKLCGCVEKVPVTSCPFYGVYKFSLRVLGLSSPWHPYVHSTQAKGLADDKMEHWK